MSEQTLSEFLFLRVLAKTDPIPDDVIVASNNPSLLSEAERAQLREFFLKAHREPRMYNFMNQRGIETFISPSLDVYAPLEKELGLSTTVTAKPGKDDEAKADEAAPTPRRGAGKQGL
jgi:ABC-type phosphate/phosphonate transport system substrate-binding protein